MRRSLPTIEPCKHRLERTDAKLRWGFNHPSPEKPLILFFSFWNFVKPRSARIFGRFPTLPRRRPTVPNASFQKNAAKLRHPYGKSTPGKPLIIEIYFLPVLSSSRKRGPILRTFVRMGMTGWWVPAFTGMTGRCGQPGTAVQTAGGTPAPRGRSVQTAGRGACSTRTVCPGFVSTRNSFPISFSTKNNTGIRNFGNSPVGCHT